ncbi:MAG: hypothetical protein HYZ88_01045 [Candidatus Omnitrophica bacterium]|nr:hypothetical protein [Candidatus Omnitrophota bacterium]
MSDQFVKALCVGSGFILMAVGLLTTRHRFEQAKRVHRKRGLIQAAMPEGWGGWFFQGFADVTVVTCWVAACFVLAVWIILGVSVIGLGLHVVR